MPTQLTRNGQLKPIQTDALERLPAQPMVAHGLRPTVERQYDGYKARETTTVRQVHTSVHPPLFYVRERRANADPVCHRWLVATRRLFSRGCQAQVWKVIFSSVRDSLCSQWYPVLRPGSCA